MNQILFITLNVSDWYVTFSSRETNHSKLVERLSRFARKNKNLALCWFLISTERDYRRSQSRFNFQAFQCRCFDYKRFTVYFNNGFKHFFKIKLASTIILLVLFMATYICNQIWLCSFKCYLCRVCTNIYLCYGPILLQIRYTIR